MKELHTILTVVHDMGLGSSAKILWIKLFDKYGYKPFSGTYEEMAEEVFSKRYTVRAQVAALREIGAIDVKQYYEQANAGCTFTLIDPYEWKD